jgi:hypothetical protein
MRLLAFALFSGQPRRWPRNLRPGAFPVSYPASRRRTLAPHLSRDATRSWTRRTPTWIVSQFTAGAVRTVTAENRGRFTETLGRTRRQLYAGPPGTYGVKGIFMEGRTLEGRRRGPLRHPSVRRGSVVLDAELRRVEQARALRRRSLRGSSMGHRMSGRTGSPSSTTSTSRTARTIRCSTSRNPWAWASSFGPTTPGGAGGGTSTCTDGTTVWSFSTDGGPKYVYRADGRPFGTGRAQRNNVYRPEGWVTAMAYGKGAVYVAERGLHRRVGQARLCRE